MSWQWFIVALIEALAVGYLVWRVVGGRRPKVLEKPDVPASALVRKHRPPSQGPG